MVLTDLPFDRRSIIQSRYEIIRRPGSAPPEGKDEEDVRNESKEYAAFLRDQNKKPSKKVEQEKKFGQGASVDSKLKYTYTTSSKYERSAQKDENGRPKTVIDLSLQVEKDKKNYEKRIKTIEDHMWQHKQEERELKRAEGDIVKNQRAVRQTVRGFEQSINKKRFAEEKKLGVGLEKYTRLQRDYTHNKEELTKQRTEKVSNLEHANKDKDRKVKLATSNLARQYQSKLDELELKSVQVDRLSRDYETKIRLKEEEQFRLKQELAELAIALNMEAQKGRQTRVDGEKERRRELQAKIDDDKANESALNNKLLKSQGDVKGADITKRKLSADLTLTKAHMAIKAREEGRHLQDTHIKLEDNRAHQRQLNLASMHADMELKTKKLEQKLQATESRKMRMMSQALREKKEREEAQESLLSQKHIKRYNEQKRREHEDHLKHFQKKVRKSEEIEQDLYGKVRNAEYARQKQEQSVRRMQNKLGEIKRKNAVKLKEETVNCQNAEREMEQQLIREQAELDKVHAQREENYFTLQKHRALMQEEKHHCTEHEREHERLMRIGTKTEMVMV
ncbi:trichohyalin-like isoform X1 [Lineus longissimus]|uniref:trichohyalin-like isoform X1 n=1 Tax=Lineus longissimus TaxID=88925 RepID=UPI002B4CBFCE